MPGNACDAAERAEEEERIGLADEARPTNIKGQVAFAIYDACREPLGSGRLTTPFREQTQRALADHATSPDEVEAMITHGAHLKPVGRIVPSPYDVSLPAAFATRSTDGLLWRLEAG